MTFASKKYIIENIEYTINHCYSPKTDEHIEIICIDYDKCKKYEYKIDNNASNIINNIKLLYRFMQDCFEKKENNFRIVKNDDAIYLYATLETKYRNERYNYILQEKKISHEEKMEIKIENMETNMKKEMEKLNKKVIDQEKLIDELNNKMIKNDELNKKEKNVKIEGRINIASLGLATVYLGCGNDFIVPSITNGNRIYAEGVLIGQSTSPCWVKIYFIHKQTIDRVVVYMFQDTPFPAEPSDTLTLKEKSIDFQVQGWNDQDQIWINLGDPVIDNKLVKRTVNFDKFSTNAIRIFMLDCLGKRLNIIEIETWSSPIET